MRATTPGETASTLAVLVAGRRPDGGLLVLGRGMDEITALRRIVLHALMLGVLPTIVLALLVGTLLSLRAMRRIKTIRMTIDRVMRGHLHERLPSGGTHDDLDQLVAGVNRMLDEIVRLLNEVKDVGDNIAHDLRTPLSAMRAKLERGLAKAGPDAPLYDTIQSALADLDKVLVIITALLRIAEIENNNRRTAFEQFDLSDLAAEVHELYDPFAEAKAIAFRRHDTGPLLVRGRSRPADGGAGEPDRERHQVHATGWRGRHLRLCRDRRAGPADRRFRPRNRAGRTRRGGQAVLPHGQEPS